MDTPGAIRLAPGVTIANADLRWSMVASGGPGGQHANKTATKAELRIRLTDLVGLHADAVRRLADAAGQRLTGDGEVVITCDETRSQRTNKDLALDRLRELVLAAQVRPKARKRTRPGRGAIERRLEGKAHTSARKRNRRAGED
jgi:ribosome-associated protein